MTLPLVILGSARPDGETRKAVDIAFPPGTIELVVLPDFTIGGYDYNHVNADDAFGPIARKMAEAEKIVFATPVYWYAMSAPLKIFFDRLTDMTENLKALGKNLSGKAVWVIATGACAISGGIMAGAYASGHGVDEWLPVDIHVPGCPPNPAAIIQALLLLQGRMPQQVHGGRYGE